VIPPNGFYGRALIIKDSGIGSMPKRQWRVEIRHGLCRRPWDRGDMTAALWHGVKLVIAACGWLVHAPGDVGAPDAHEVQGLGDLRRCFVDEADYEFASLGGGYQRG
jgi:hypothetical protein